LPHPVDTVDINLRYRQSFSFLILLHGDRRIGDNGVDDIHVTGWSYTGGQLSRSQVLSVPLVVYAA